MHRCVHKQQNRAHPFDLTLFVFIEIIAFMLMGDSLTNSPRTIHSYLSSPLPPSNAYMLCHLTPQHTQYKCILFAVEIIRTQFIDWLCIVSVMQIGNVPQKVLCSAD